MFLDVVIKLTQIQLLQTSFAFIEVIESILFIVV